MQLVLMAFCCLLGVVETASYNIKQIPGVYPASYQTRAAISAANWTACLWLCISAPDCRSFLFGSSLCTLGPFRMEVDSSTIVINASITFTALYPDEEILDVLSGRRLDRIVPDGPRYMRRGTRMPTWSVLAEIRAVNRNIGKESVLIDIVVRINVAKFGTAQMSSQLLHYSPEFLIDGGKTCNLSSFPTFGQTSSNQRTPEWVSIYLRGRFKVEHVNIYLRNDCCTERIEGSIVTVSRDLNRQSGTNRRCENVTNVSKDRPYTFLCGVQGQYVTVQSRMSGQPLDICEVEVFSAF